MPLTSHMINSFFRDAHQMGLSARNQAQLAGEGITDLDDLADFDNKEAWAQIVENCKRPPKIVDPNNANQPVAQEPFQLPAKYLMRLKVDTKAVKYFNSIDRPLTMNMMTWDNYLRNFKMEWEYLQEMKKGNNDSSLPIILKTLPIDKWFEAHKTYCTTYVGQSGCTLSWIYREESDVPTAEALAPDQPYSAEHGLVDEEMVQRLARAGCQFKADKNTGLSHVVTATLGTIYAKTLSPFKRSKDSCSAMIAMKAQFAGPAH